MHLWDQRVWVAGGFQEFDGVIGREQRRLCPFGRGFGRVDDVVQQGGGVQYFKVCTLGHSDGLAGLPNPLDMGQIMGAVRLTRPNAAQFGQVKCVGGRGHGYTIPATIARRVSRPSPLAELVCTSSG